MLDWLRLLLMVFYAPARGIREVRDRGALAASALVALIANGAFLLAVVGLFLPAMFNLRQPLAILLVVFKSAGCLLFVVLIIAPLAIFLLNVIDRRGSYRVIMQQEFAAVASTFLYGLAASSLITLVLTLAGKFSGVLTTFGNDTFQSFTQQQQAQLSPEKLQQIQPFLNAPFFTFLTVCMLLALIFLFWAVAALQIVFRIAWIRSLLIVVVSVIVVFPTFFFLQPLFSMILASPLLLIMLFFLMRGYFGEIARAQRARTSFKQNLEAATLNPADASAHYNLGLIHQTRGEFDLARERFERAVQIDAEEIDAHYQLGRIARQQKRFADAVQHFEQVVARDQSHAQYEIWREVGATYIAAGQFEDARGVLERFLDRRESDPEALYLMGRAEAGLGHKREAASMMEACINAVKTSPAYKYRLEKRWLNEAQQFLKSQV